MGMFDTISGVPDAYSNQVKCWDNTLRSYSVGDAVPSVGVATNYSICLADNSEGLRVFPPLFAIVQGNLLTQCCSLEPLEGCPVFDKWGGYLGHGDKWVERVKPQNPSGPATGAWTVRPPDPEPHRIKLRPKLEVSLPRDITQEEVEMLKTWLIGLPVA